VHKVGVLALQGASGRHAEALADLGAYPVDVRSPEDLTGVEALVLPGGESTTISKLLTLSGLFEPIAERLAAGMPALGTCAGLILLASEILDGRPDQRSFSALDVAVRRNGFGRQVESFETDLEVDGLAGGRFPAVFIRAPVIERVGEAVEVLASVAGTPVLCRQGAIMGAAFHPELSGDLRLHQRFLEVLHMSGHSKWATIKHQKGAKDKVRAKVFAKVLRQVEVAAREGGPDMSANATLRAMYQKAREASVPTDTIERAIKRATGELEGVRYEPVNYEGYAPMGVAIYVETLTDNRNRTGADVRAIFSKNGGASAEPGAVAWQFERKAVIIVGKPGPSGRGSGEPGPSGRGSVVPGVAGDEDELMLVGLEAGAENLEDQGDTWQLTAPPTDLGRLRDALEAAGVKVTSAELTMVATSTIALESEVDARKVLRVVDALEDHDDVQAVYANFDIPDHILTMMSV